MTSKNNEANPITIDISGELQQLLDLQYGGAANDILKSSLSKPIFDLTHRPRKQIRGRLVEVGFRLAGGLDEVQPHQKEIIRVLSKAIEFLHAGSLAIDDLQDGSKMRRGQPALHVKYGLPVAINVGNTLYFWPLEMIRALRLPPQQELDLYRLYHRTLIRAHLGQALDIGIPIDTLPQESIHDVCLAAMELKSGALFSLGLLMGAMAAESPDDFLKAINRFGHGFGIGLQMFDDLGNMKGALEPGKRWEDLILRRPTWVWACVSKYYSPDAFRQFVSAARQIPQDPIPLETWLDLHDFYHKAKQLAVQHLESCFSTLEGELMRRNLSLKPLSQLRDIGLEIAKAYE